VEISDEVVAVALIQTHERATHDDEFDLVGVVPETLQLLDSILGLEVRIISCSDCSH
jgi:hypothetical protein